MSNEKEISQIIEYLLGNLPENETEQFDELSFTDDDFAEKIKTAENDLIDRYLQNELDPKTQQRFENYYLASPLRREKLKFAETLQIYAERNKKKTSEPEKIGYFAFIANIFNTNKMQFAVAASVILFMTLVGLWIFTNRNKQPEIGQQTAPTPAETTSAISENSANENKSSIENNVFSPTATATATSTPTQTPTATPTVAPIEPKPVIASILLTPPLRNSKIQTLSLNQKTTNVAISLELESNDYTNYTVSLLDSNGKSLFQGGKQKAKGNTSKFLNLNFPAKLLTDGFYTLSVSGVKADGTGEIISDYLFRAVLR